MKKKCNTCLETKSVFAFHADRKQRDRLASSCADCRNAQQRKAYNETRATGRAPFGGVMDVTTKKQGRS